MRGAILPAGPGSPPPEGGGIQGRRQPAPRGWQSPTPLQTVLKAFALTPRRSGWTAAGAIRVRCCIYPSGAALCCGHGVCWPVPPRVLVVSAGLAGVCSAALRHLVRWRQAGATALPERASGLTELLAVGAEVPSWSLARARTRQLTPSAPWTGLSVPGCHTGRYKKAVSVMVGKSSKTEASTISIQRWGCRVFRVGQNKAWLWRMVLFLSAPHCIRSLRIPFWCGVQQENRSAQLTGHCDTLYLGNFCR